MNACRERGDRAALGCQVEPITRNVFYMGKPEYSAVVQYPPALDVAVTAGIFIAFLVIGTIMFVRADRNR